MCHKNNLVHHQVTSVGQKVKKNAVEIVEQFIEDMKNIGEFANLEKMDETPCFFDIPRSSTIHKKGIQTVKVKTTGAERLYFTVALTVGVKKTEKGFTLFRLPPLLIFRNLVKAPPGKYHVGKYQVNISSWLRRGRGGGSSEMFHDERNLRESYLEKKVRWVFQYRKIHFVNGLC